jgi:chromosome segregation ATPase
MARAKFAAIEEDIKTLNDQVSKDVEKASKFDRLGKLLAGTPLSEVKLDMDDQDFEAVRAADAAVTENIAKLIHGLDEITQGFSADFTGMSEATVSEKLIGMFSRKKSEAMKAERVRSASIDGSLNELIRKSDTIGRILNTQLNVLQDRNVKVIDGQKNVNELYEATAEKIAELEVALSTLDAEHSNIVAKAAETTGPELASLETQVAEIANKLNTAREDLQTQTALQQSLSGYRQQFANYAESLAKQIAAQKTMIEKLKLDTEQRSILYKTLTESIKAAQQQELAHQIDETGRATDNMADTLMTQIGASAQNRVMTMLERHKDYEKQLQQKAGQREAANQKFAARFTDVLKDIENRYVEAQ